VYGYHYFGELSWLDALLNASMILSGMGPVNELRTTAGKLFATFYALFSGVAFITIVGVLFAPVIHRFLHKFHLEFESRRTANTAALASSEIPVRPRPCGFGFLSANDSLTCAVASAAPDTRRRGS
jgi:hypothetical protein